VRADPRSAIQEQESDDPKNRIFPNALNPLSVKTLPLADKVFDIVTGSLTEKLPSNTERLITLKVPPDCNDSPVETDELKTAQLSDEKPLFAVTIPESWTSSWNRAFDRTERSPRR
jgi:hypothetical protein